MSFVYGFPRPAQIFCFRSFAEDIRSFLLSCAQGSSSRTWMSGKSRFRPDGESGCLRGGDRNRGPRSAIERFQGRRQDS